MVSKTLVPAPAKIGFMAPSHVWFGPGPQSPREVRWLIDDGPRRTRACLVLGGARSGKSAYAQALAESMDGAALVYLATAEAWDAEMAERVGLHQAARGARWRTVEEPLALVPALAAAAQPGAVVLVDCLTLWLSNLMLGNRDVDAETAHLVEAVGQLMAPVIFVSNEVGQGIVPDSRLGRDFRDRQGRLNQRMAAACDTVVLVAAGLPLQLKPAARPAITLA